MDLEDLAKLSNLVLEYYFNKCIYCFRRETCGALDKIMNKTMDLMKEFIFSDNLGLFSDDLELIREP